MDKVKKVREFSLLTASITVVEGSVTKCSFGNEKASSKFGHFYNLLEKAMREFCVRSPRKFDEMYKSLYLSTREYKMARKIKAEVEGRG